MIETTVRKRKKSVQWENKLQENLFRWASMSEVIHPELKMMFAIPNGGVRGGNPRQRMINGMMLKRQGVRNGVPDIFLAVPKSTYHGLWIEMKHGKNTQSDEQKDWQKRLEAQGYLYKVCYSTEIAKLAILEYLDITDSE